MDVQASAIVYNCGQDAIEQEIWHKRPTRKRSRNMSNRWQPSFSSSSFG